MFKTLQLLRDIVFYGFALIKKISKAIRIRKVGDAFEKSSEDQRSIEGVIADSSGLPSNDDYEGMRTREAKKRS